MSFSLPKRPRRNRRSANLRALVRESSLVPSDLVMPLFVVEGKGKCIPIKSMPGQNRLSCDQLIAECRELAGLGVPAVALFPVIPEKLKSKNAAESAREKGLYCRAIRMLKSKLPDLTVISDVAMDPYSSDGHDGLLSDSGEILNDETLPILADMALAQCRAGADLIAPSDMMDGRVAYLRKALDRENFKHVGILSYTAKYASSFYGPFREALDSAPKQGDKKTYQIDPANVQEALREAALDIEEGADMIMVKPGIFYLDVLRAISEKSTVPVAAYNVSGEYAMLKAAGERGWIDYPKAVLEALLSFKRAGANFVLTYHAKEVAQWLA